MNILNKLLLVGGCALLLGNSVAANATVNVFACEPEWQSLVQTLGGDKVSVVSATNGLQDPHHVQARPSLISKMRNADLMVCTGADLEVGWLPILLRRASNANISAGKTGYFFAANYVKLLGIPKIIDRSQGDVHAAGNPHIQTSPKNVALVAKALVQRLQTIDPVNSDYYQQRTDDFLAKWKIAERKWKKELAPLRGAKIIVQHTSWDYLMDFAHFKQVGTIEEKPGIPATSGHLVELMNKFKPAPADLIIHASYQDKRPSEWLSQHTGIPAVTLPFTVGGSDQATDLFKLYDQTFAIIIGAIKHKS